MAKIIAAKLMHCCDNPEIIKALIRALTFWMTRKSRVLRGLYEQKTDDEVKDGSDDSQENNKHYGPKDENDDFANDN